MEQHERQHELRRGRTAVSGGTGPRTRQGVVSDTPSTTPTSVLRVSVEASGVPAQGNAGQQTVMDVLHQVQESYE